MYLPDEDFDGIDWQVQHQPKHGPQSYDAHSKKDIQLLSDPFFQPGIGHQIDDKPVNSLQATQQQATATQNFQNAHNVAQSVSGTGSVAVAKPNTAGAVVQSVDPLGPAKVGSTAGPVNAPGVSISPVANTIQNTNAVVSSGTGKASLAEVAATQNAVQNAVNANVAAAVGTNAANNAKGPDAVNIAMQAIENAKQVAANTQDNQGKVYIVYLASLCFCKRVLITIMQSVINFELQKASPRSCFSTIFLCTFVNRAL